MRYLVHSMQEESRFTDKKIVVMAIKLNKRQFNNVFIVESIMKCIFWLNFSRKRGRVIGRKEGDASRFSPMRHKKKASEQVNIRD
jgi:hypothetical protein